MKLNERYISFFIQRDSESTLQKSRKSNDQNEFNEFTLFDG